MPKIILSTPFYIKTENRSSEHCAMRIEWSASRCPGGLQCLHNIVIFMPIALLLSIWKPRTEPLKFQTIFKANNGNNRPTCEVKHSNLIRWRNEFEQKDSHVPGVRLQFSVAYRCFRSAAFHLFHNIIFFCCISFGAFVFCFRRGEIWCEQQKTESESESSV